MVNGRERAELIDFLRDRRARFDPVVLGMPRTMRRRTPGLRREEVAQLAGVSTDWYTRLEQGRDVHPSASVLDALAQALQLDVSERDHLFTLAGGDPPRRTTPIVEHLQPGLVRVLDVLRMPAFILGRRWDVLAWNDGAARLIVDLDALPPGQRNLLWLIFLRPDMRVRYTDWERTACEAVAYFRASATRNLEDPAVIDLIEELSRCSSDFRRLWKKHAVREKTSGIKAFQHPDVGLLHLRYEPLSAAEDSDQRLIIYIPTDAESTARLESLLG